MEKLKILKLNLPSDLQQCEHDLHEQSLLLTKSSGAQLKLQSNAANHNKNDHDMISMSKYCNINESLRIIEKCFNIGLTNLENIQQKMVKQRNQCQVSKTQNMNEIQGRIDALVSEEKEDSNKIVRIDDEIETIETKLKQLKSDRKRINDKLKLTKNNIDKNRRDKKVSIQHFDIKINKYDSNIDKYNQWKTKGLFNKQLTQLKGDLEKEFDKMLLKWETWNEQDTKSFIKCIVDKECNDEKCVKYIENIESRCNDLSGKDLKNLSELMLKMIGIDDENDRKKIIIAVKTAIGPKCADEKDETTDGVDCIICTNARVNILYLACGHLCLCESCYKQWNQQNNQCPKCRTKSTGIQKVYLSGF